MAGSIVQVQTALGIAGGGSIAASITISAGNHIVAIAGGLLGTTATITMSDDGGGTWNNATTTTPANAIRKSAYSENRGAGTYSVTATFGSANWIDRSLVLLEVSGLATSSSLDQTTGQHQGSATGTDSVTSGNPSATTNASDFVIGATWNYNDSKNASAGTGFSAASGSPYSMDGNDVSVESKSVSSTGVYPATFTPSAGGSAWDTHVVIFKEAGGGGGLTAQPENQDTPRRKAIRKQADQAQPLPASSRPWVFSEPTRGPRQRPRTADLSAVPVPPLAGPVPVAGLKLWLRGDLGIGLSGPNVVSWADQSGCGNNVTGSILYNPSSINGKPGLTFTGGTGMVNGASNIVAGNSPRTIFVVSRQSSAATYSSLLTIRTSTLKADYLAQYAGGGGLVYTDGVNGANNASISPHSVVSATIIAEWSSAGPGTLLGYKENGAAFTVTQASGSSTDSGTTGFVVGGGSGVAFSPFNGEIDEILVYDSALSAGDEALVFSYLYARYFSPWVQVDTPTAARRLRREVTSSFDPVPPLSAPAGIVPLSGAPDHVRPRTRRPEQLRVDPVPPLASARYVPQEQTLVSRVVRRVVNFARDVVGLPALLPPPPVEPKLKPPLWAVFDAVELTAEADPVTTSATTDEVTLSLDDDT